MAIARWWRLIILHCRKWKLAEEEIHVAGLVVDDTMRLQVLRQELRHVISEINLLRSPQSIIKQSTGR